MLISVALSLLASGHSSMEGTPNVVLILADDLGYGDVSALAPESSLSTPYLDALAEQGMTFVDAHSPSAVCTPTRYGTLTGTYCWRSRLKKGVLGGYSKPLLDPGQPTLGTLLQAAGHRTATIGKWHLGMDLPMKTDDADTGPWSGDPGIDWGGTITDGPTHHGFDAYFGVTASLDMAPYVYVRDDAFVGEPVAEQPAQPFPHFVRRGPLGQDFDIANVLDDLTREAVSFIKSSAEAGEPFFLYMPLTAPHKPTIAHERFKGETELGEYGDFIVQTDWSVGQVLAALDEAGVADETLVVFTSDNGSYMYRYPEGSEDHVSVASKQGFAEDRHLANGSWRGTKADVYEAGHRVPFFVRWPGRVEAGSSCDEPICHVDLFATFAEIFGQAVPEGHARDSVSLVPMLEGVEGARRGVPVVHHSVNGTFALRDGRWKAVFSSGSGGREKPSGKPFDGVVRLFDMLEDPGETRDVAGENPEVLERMVQALQSIRGVQ